MTNIIPIDYRSPSSNDFPLEYTCSQQKAQSHIPRLDVSRILEAVGNVIREYDSPEIDPTPIGPLGVHVVEKVRLTDWPCLIEDRALTDCLSPLLRKTVDEIKTKSMSLSNWDGKSKKFFENDQSLQLPSSNSCIDSSSSVVSCGSASISECANENPLHIRAHQSEQWNIRYWELVEFQQSFGHCLVPNYWEKNPRLALWVKRQRYQYKLKKEGHHSTLRDEREEKLEQLGFVWDSHRAMWEERLHELEAFKELRGNCNVPANYPKNRQLAIWVKCQRRQYRLFCDGERSHMTPERISKLVDLGFVWNPRKHKASK